MTAEILHRYRVQPCPEDIGKTAWELTHVFAGPGAVGPIDAVYKGVDEAYYTMCRGLSLDEIRQEYPNARLTTWEEAQEAKDAAYRCPPVRTTKERFWYALECVPPLRWKTTSAGETFAVGEATSGTMHSLYARIGDDYYVLTDDLDTPHEEILRRCREELQEMMQAAVECPEHGVINRHTFAASMEDAFYEGFGHGAEVAADYCPKCYKLGVLLDPEPTVGGE